MKRDISTDKHFIGKIAPDTYFDFATPYGYGGWLIEGNEDTSKLFDSYLSWCKENGIISEFVRFHPVLKNHVYSENNYDVIPLGETIAMDLTSPDVIWQNIISKNRNMIRKAITLMTEHKCYIVTHDHDLFESERYKDIDKGWNNIRIRS